MPSDIRGKTVAPGAVIAYSAWKSSGALLKTGTVTQVTEDAAWVSWKTGTQARTKASPTKITLDPAKFIVLEEAA